MMKAQVTRSIECSVSTAKEIVVGRPALPVEKGNGGFATWLIMASQCYKEGEGETDRSVVDKPKTNSTVRSILRFPRQRFRIHRQ